MTPGKFTKKDIKEFELDLVKSLYAEGFSIEEIIEKVNISFATVRYHLKKEGLLKKKKALDKDTTEKIIIKLFEEGNSEAEISFQTRISRIAVINVLKKAKLVKTKCFYGGREFDNYRTRRQYQKEVNINVRMDYDKGKKIKEIAAAYKISAFAVRKILGTK